MNALIRRRTLAVLGLLGGAGVLGVQGCGESTSETCAALHECDSDGGGLLDGAPGPDATSSGDATTGDDAPSGNDAQAGNEGGADANADTAPPCDSTQTPSQNACVIADGLAIFVSPTGSDTSGTGTMELPVATITKGIALAQTTSTPRVIACGATYAEAVSLTATTGGVSLFGGVACPGSDAGAAWAYTGVKAVAQPAAHGYALSVSGVTATLAIEDFEFDAQNGTAAGESSIAGFLSASPNVTLQRVKLAAGTGVKGADGVLTPVTYPTATQLQGGTASGDTAGPGCSLTCPGGGATSGGIGGAGGAPAGGDGTAGTPALDGGVGQTAAECLGGNGTMLAGASATTVADSAGANALGALSSSNVWSPASGVTGGHGMPGQGGGGGGGAATGAGGGGGCGGCGGAGATGGSGGGASIGLLVVGAVSTISLDTCEIVATAAGGGGAGVAGQTGQTPGGARGTGAGTACNGGNGGAGGKGGASGGGAGGVSVGVLYQGTSPTLTSTTPTVPSTLAAGGTAGGSANGGLAGVSVATMSL